MLATNRLARSTNPTTPLPFDWQPPVVKLPAPTAPRPTRTAESMAVTQPFTFDAVAELARWSRS